MLWINPLHLRGADFNAFFEERKNRLLSTIADAMGKETVRDDLQDLPEAAVYVEEPDDIDEEDLDVPQRAAVTVDSA